MTLGGHAVRFGARCLCVGAMDAEGALKGAYVDAVWPRYQTCKHHWSVAFRAWRPFNFNEAGIGDERLCHVLLA